MQVNALGVGVTLVDAVVNVLVISVVMMARNIGRSASAQKQMTDTLVKIADDKKQT